MTNKPRSISRRLIAGLSAGAALLAVGAVAAAPLPGHTTAAPAAATAVTPTYPFEGTWIRADRPCTAHATIVRTYTAHEVYSSRNQCAIHRVANNGRTFELLEECRHSPAHVTETIRMLTGDLLSLKRQVFRLKIPRSVKFARCAAATPLGPLKK